MLRDGVYELRARSGNVNYRILYFFHGQNVAVLAHSLTKEAKVPKSDIERAIRRMGAFEKDPDGHSYREDETHG
jgi:phage-related protein